MGNEPLRVHCVDCGRTVAYQASYPAAKAFTYWCVQCQMANAQKGIYYYGYQQNSE